MAESFVSFLSAKGECVRGKEHEDSEFLLSDILFALLFHTLTVIPYPEKGRGEKLQ